MRNMKAAASRLIISIDELRKDDASSVGSKTANLGELSSAGLPIPRGFSITADSYMKFLERTGTGEKIRSLIEGLEVSDWKTLERRARAISNLILKSAFPTDLAREIRKASSKLGLGDGKALVVRSSARHEDLPDASFAGVHDSFINITDFEEALRCVAKCWASLWSPRAIFYRSRCGFDHEKLGMGVIIQEFIPADSAGVMFSNNPVTSAENEIVINSCWGLGTEIVSGSRTPDSFVIDKNGLTVKKCYIADKATTTVASPAGFTRRIRTATAKRSEPSLTDEELVGLAKICMKAEAIFGTPQDIEWAIRGRKIYILQSRPISTLLESAPFKRAKK
jgi:pyruvate,water dikinase